MSKSDRIRIKFLAKFRPGADGKGWENTFPGPPDAPTTWGNCDFIFDRHERSYDWLVVWDDLPSVAGERHTMWEESLACPRENTLLVTTEPSTIKIYGTPFLRQFGHVLTSQEPWATGHHPGAIYSQTSYVWFYADKVPRTSYDHIRSYVPLRKTKQISVVCSVKQQRHTLHRKRFEFVSELKKYLPELEHFGKGVKFIEEKADALDDYKYHIAIENFYGPHHWTEKLADPFLGACMPIYHGCPNAEDYFPPESFIRIDISDVGTSVETIRRAMRDRLYEKNLSAVLESRRRVVEEYAPIAHLSRLVNELHQPDAPLPSPGDTIASRHALRRRSLFNGISFLAEKTGGALRHRFSKSAS